MRATDTTVKKASTSAPMELTIFAGVLVVCVYISAYLFKCSVLTSCAASQNLCLAFHSEYGTFVGDHVSY